MAPAAFAPVERVVPFGVLFDATAYQYQVLFDPAGLAADTGQCCQRLGPRLMYLVKLQEAVFVSMPSPE